MNETKCKMGCLQRTDNKCNGVFHYAIYDQGTWTKNGCYGFENTAKGDFTTEVERPLAKYFIRICTTQIHTCDFKR